MITLKPKDCGLGRSFKGAQCRIDAVSIELRMVFRNH
jgi:hypothetical protein